jgi:segregation and condensation protein A
LENADNAAFEPTTGDYAGDDQLVVDLEGYEGPLDVLLALARSQKVDLAKISILALVEQYIAFINRVRQLRLEIAADYLVMAAWLAYLKSRLLLPEEPGDGEPTGEEMAARLTFQLQRLEAMRQRGAEIMSRHRLGVDVFARGEPEGVTVIRHSRYDLSLYELLRAYAVQEVRHDARHVVIARPPVYSIEDAIERLRAMLGSFPDWTQLESFLPNGTETYLEKKSALASTFAASLEVAKQGFLELRQLQTFGPIFIRPLAGRNE